MSSYTYAVVYGGTILVDKNELLSPPLIAPLCMCQEIFCVTDVFLFLSQALARGEMILTGVQRSALCVFRVRHQGMSCCKESRIHAHVDFSLVLFLLACIPPAFEP